MSHSRTAADGKVQRTASMKTNMGTNEQTRIKRAGHKKGRIHEVRERSYTVGRQSLEQQLDIKVFIDVPSACVEEAGRVS